jgi:hypothetical protein
MRACLTSNPSPTLAPVPQSSRATQKVGTTCTSSLLQDTYSTYKWHLSTTSKAIHKNKTDMAQNIMIIMADKACTTALKSLDQCRIFWDFTSCALQGCDSVQGRHNDMSEVFALCRSSFTVMLFVPRNFTPLLLTIYQQRDHHALSLSHSCFH